MSVLLAVAVRPKKGKSYALIGVDSKQIKGIFKDNNDCNLSNLEIIRVEDDFNKAFKLNNIIYGITGQADDEIMTVIHEYIRNNDSEIETLLPKIELYAKKLLKDSNDIKEQRIVITLAGRYNGEAVLAQIQLDKRGASTGSKSGFLQISKNGFVEIFAGKTREYDLQKVFRDTINGSTSLQKELVKKTMRKYLKKVATRYPETCNQNIKIFEI